MRPNVMTVATVACAVACVAACAVEPSAPSSRLVVVRAYLYAHEPVTDVRLTWTMTFDSTADPEPINDATVTLVRDGRRYTLVPAGGDSGYYRYAGTDLVVREGDALGLEVLVDGLSVTAETVVPTGPSGASLSADRLEVPQFVPIPGGPRPILDSIRVLARWTKESGALYFVTVENVDPAPIAIDTGGVFRVGRFVSVPIAADSFPIIAFTLTHLGRHRVSVYRVNEEYAQLYATRQQDSRDLNEPLTNVRGGLGVFSAFARDTAFFVAVREQE